MTADDSGEDDYGDHGCCGSHEEGGSFQSEGNENAGRDIRMAAREIKAPRLRIGPEQTAKVRALEE